jgi:hypothetical protein
MPAHRNGRSQYRVQLNPLGTQQQRRQWSLSQENADRRDEFRDLSPLEPSQPQETHLVDTIEKPFSQGNQSVAESTLSNELMEKDVENDLNQDTSSQRQATSQPDKLELLHIDEWDEEETYDEDVPSCIHYSIEWKVTLNNKLISKDTEQNLVLAPTSYWSLILRTKLEKLLCKKLSSNRRVRPDDTNVVVSVTERSQRDLTKRFDEIDIDWSVIEKQLVAWGELFRAGKKLRVDISFNYLETGQPLPASRKGDKRGFSSATQQMLTERATQLDAEGETSRQPSIWRDVYNLMRCPGPPCHLGPHCWRDPVGKKHYKLKTHQLKGLIRHVEQGGQLRSHDDVPEDIRQQLYAEEQQRLERHQKATTVSSANLPPINITNVLPGPTHQPILSSSSMADQPLVAPPPTPLVIPGLRDVAVKEYSDWQQSQVSDQTLKAEFQKACDIALADGFDLEQIHKDQNPSFFTDNGIKTGVARRFISDIEYWVRQNKCITRIYTSD